MLAIYEKVTDLQGFIRLMGAAMATSGLYGCKNEQQGCVLAWHCIVTGESPLVPMQEFDIFNGEHGSRLRKKSEAMLRSFSRRGGEWTWKSDGRDGRAVLTLEKDGKSMDSTYTVDDATKAKLIGGKNPNWATRPANMLRSRAISEGLRMFDPESCEGCYTDDEIDDLPGGDGTQATAVASETGNSAPAAPERKARSGKAKQETPTAVASQPEPASPPAPAVASPPAQQQTAEASVASVVAENLPAETKAPESPATAAPASSGLPKIVVDIIELKNAIAPLWPAAKGPFANTWETIKSSMNLPAGETDEERLTKAPEPAQQRILKWMTDNLAIVQKMSTSKDLNTWANQSPTTSATKS